MLPNSTADTNNAHGRPLSIESNSIDATKLLQNINESYDKEVKVLDESVKNSLREATGEEVILTCRASLCDLSHGLNRLHLGIIN